MIDTGASASFLPREGRVLKGSEAELLPHQSDTRIADNGKLDCTYVTYIDIQFVKSQTYRSDSKFLIINSSRHILGYDALIGTDLIKRLNINISTEGNSLIAKIGKVVVGKEDSIDKCEKNLGIVSESLQPQESGLARLQEEYKDAFAEIVTGHMKTRPMEIKLTSNDMPKARLRRYPVEDTIEIGRQVDSMLKRGVIEPSISSFSSTCHLVPKKNGQKRLVINFIPLNKLAVKDHYPLPQISDLLAHLAKAKYFCALDCTEGFWQIMVAQQDRPKTAFVTPQGLFQFKRCPFGFTNSPAVFQRAMNEVFKDGLYKKCVIYIDDILVYGTTKEETLENLEWVLKQCKAYHIKLKLSKCEFIKEDVNFLGYRVGQGSISPIPDRHISWKDSEPETVKEAQAFLGFINYYSRFLESYSERTSIMREAIKTQPFQWSEECKRAKKELLDELKSADAQVIPIADTPKQICITVLDNSIEAACLTNEGQLIMRTSAILSSTQKNYSTLEKELLALVRAYSKFGPILRGPVTVKTSCIMLPQVLKLKEKPDRVARLLLQLPPEAEFEVKAVNDVSEALRKMAEPPDETFYTDGALKMRPNSTPLASWAVVSVNNPELSCSGIIENGTNQKAEIEAVVQACEVATQRGLKRVLIVTDSKYVTSACEKWIDTWEENGWLDHRNKVVKNEEAFKRLSKAKKNLDMKIVHVKGHSGDKYNELADRMAKEALLKHLSVCATIYSPPTLEQDNDPELSSIKHKLEEGEKVRDYFLKNGLLWNKKLGVEKLVVPKCQKSLLLELAHNDPIYGAHYGVKKTRRKLEHYYWSNMNSDIAKFVSSCEVCQRHKVSKQKQYGKLMPIKTSNIFNRIHLDIIGPVISTPRGNKLIVTGIDAFSRMGFARAYPSVTAEEIIEVVKEEVIYRHGPPAHIVTDNGTQFTSNRFQEFVSNLDIKHSTTCEYNPQSNGMDERFNATLVSRLRNLVNNDILGWDLVLQSAVLAYNLTSNDSSKLSPYTIVYGRLARSPLNPIDLECESDLLDHAAIHNIAAQNTLASQEQAATQYDRKRQDVKFKPLDIVMVRTVGRLDSKKLAPKFTGPHCILRILEHDGVGKALEILDSDTFRIRRVPFGAVKDYYPPQGGEQGGLPGELIVSNTASAPPIRTGNLNQNDIDSAIAQSLALENIIFGQEPLAIMSSQVIESTGIRTEVPSEHVGTAEQAVTHVGSENTEATSHLLVENASECVDGTRQATAATGCTETTGHNASECVDGTGQATVATECTEATGHPKDDNASEYRNDTGQVTVATECPEYTGHLSVGNASEYRNDTGQVTVATEYPEYTGQPTTGKVSDCVEDTGSIEAATECSETADPIITSETSDCMKDTGPSRAEKECQKCTELTRNTIDYERDNNPFLPSPDNSDISAPTPSTLSCKSPH